MTSLLDISSTYCSGDQYDIVFENALYIALVFSDNDFRHDLYICSVFSVTSFSAVFCALQRRSYLL